MSIVIGECKVAEILNHPDFPGLKEEYIRECANAQLPRPEEKFLLYTHLENAGALYCLRANYNGRLVGFCVLIISELPHYGRCIAVTESLFLAEEHRSGCAGIRLIKKAEEIAKGVGAPAIITSAPIGGALDKVLPKQGYTCTNRAYTKVLNDESRY